MTDEPTPSRFAPVPSDETSSAASSTPPSASSTTPLPTRYPDAGISSGRRWLRRLHLWARRRRGRDDSRVLYLAQSSPYSEPRLDLTHLELPQLRSYRRRLLEMKAIQLPVPFQVTTIDDNLAYGKAGDYLCEDLEGGRYPCKKEIFEKLYEPVQDPAPAP